MTINVTATHIAKGIRCKCGECPLALALSEHFNESWWVGIATAGSGYPGTKRFDLPKKAFDFRSSFDRSLPVEPFSFEISFEKGGL